MAKRRRVKPDQQGDRTPASAAAAAVAAPTKSSESVRVDPVSIALGLLAAAVVYVSYYPSDSVAVEKGDALWFGVLAITIATISWSAHVWTGRGTQPAGSAAADRHQSMLDAASRILDLCPWVLAAWMMLAAFATSPPGNLRMATNEAWLWVSAAAVLTGTRRLMSGLRTRQAMLVLVVVCGTGLAVHGLHQYLISLPASRSEYQRDPERILQLAGVDAPPGSAERVVFENRLFDGGPTGTFALANSLAAILVAVAVLSVGVLRFHWHDLRGVHRGAWFIVAIGCLSCLMATRSRSAILAMLAGIVLILIASSRLRDRNPRKLLLGLAGLLVLSAVTAGFIGLFGNREWFEEAPASLAFRLQYWRSTWQMVLDQPLFGAGPGNFQSIYERYREASASEQIAEPHNLMFETLAAGGFFGLGMLLITMSAGLVVLAMRPSGTSTCDGQTPDQRAAWVWLGAILAVVMVWLIGWASRRPPDLQASLYVLPTSVAAAAVLWPTVSGLASRDLDTIFAIMLVSTSVHLMFAGGWTVPGVAMLLWVGSATLTRVQWSAGGSTHRRRWPAVSVIGCGMLLLAALYVMSLRPVERQKRLMAAVEMAQSSGQVGTTLVTLQRAVEADPWSPDAMLWLADFYRWKIILQSNSDRTLWEASLAEAKRRGGDDPAVYRMIGAQQLHVYQRHGDAADLDAAAETFGMAAQWSPSNEWLIAQMAVLASAQGNTAEARRLTQRAAEFFQLGLNLERGLWKQLVYVAQPLGPAANRGPIRRPADQLLGEPNDDDSRTSDNGNSAD